MSDSGAPAEPKKMQLPFHPNGGPMHARAVNFEADSYARPTSKIWVGTGGSLEVVLAGDTEPVWLHNIHDGTEIIIGVCRFLSGTASDVVAFW